jgi:hypothetical protein
MSANHSQSNGILRSDDRPIQKLKVFFEVYRSEFVPVYADVVTILNAKPDETLYEIEQMLSHIDKAFDTTLGEQDRINNVEKAKGHLERAILDCIKITWIEINNKLDLICSDTQKMSYCISMKEGEFTKKYLEYKDMLAAARRIELESVGVSPSKSIPEYKKAIRLGKELLECIDYDKLDTYTKKASGISASLIMLVVGISIVSIAYYISQFNGLFINLIDVASVFILFSIIITLLIITRKRITGLIYERWRK